MPRVGHPTSFYHEGGHGERRWVVGWRYGIIRAIPIKGSKKNWIQVELPVPKWSHDGKAWHRRANERVWVHVSVVNQPYDFKYHGLNAVEALKARTAEKQKQQAKADKRKPSRK